MGGGYHEMAKGKNVTVSLTGVAMAVSIGTAHAQAFRPLPDEHSCYALIGLITSECARIEHFLDAAIFEMLGLQSEARLGTCVTGQMVGMFPRYMALHQLAIEKGIPAPLQSEIKKLTEASSGVATRRNRAVHDAWMEEMHSKEPHQFRTKNKKDTAYGPQPSPIEKLQDDLAFVRNHLERVMRLRSDLWELYRQKP